MLGGIQWASRREVHRGTFLPHPSSGAGWAPGPPLPPRGETCGAASPGSYLRGPRCQKPWGGFGSALFQWEAVGTGEGTGVSLRISPSGLKATKVLGQV